MRVYWPFLVVIIVLSASNAAYSLDYDLGENITIYDGVSTRETGWAGKNEDQEVEPGMVQAQIWDLEAFYFNGTVLSLVGGYDFKNGVSDLDSGDIFIDIDGDAVYGPSNDGTGYKNSIVTNTFGYEYAITLNYGDGIYSVYELNDETTSTTVYYSQNQESNPWRYNAGGELKTTGSFTYLTGLGDFDGLQGGSHNLITGLDLSFLGDDISRFIAHYTMECGNDNLMGQQVAPVPEPATLFLLGSGLFGLAGIRRKAMKK